MNEAFLTTLVEVGVLEHHEVLLARRLTAMVDDADPQVLLATCLALRAPRAGHVCVELAGIGDRLAVEPRPGQGDGAGAAARIAALDWPDADAWQDHLLASDAVGGPGTADVPLVLDHGRLYLARYWRYERELADAVRRRAVGRDPGASTVQLVSWLDRLFGPPGELDRQRLAAAVALTRSLTVLAGGPGTGKTYTVARILAALQLAARAQGRGDLQVGLAAPTGKAAARLTASIQGSVDGLGLDADLAAELRGTQATTIHRLLGVRPDSATRFRHDAGAPLPHDVVIVDEASMVSLPLMAKLVDAVRDEARLVLVGDRDQLASVEAGAVLGDLCGPDGSRPVLRLSPAAAEVLDPLVGGALEPVVELEPEPGVWDGIVRLDRYRRFDAAGGIARLAAVIRDGGDRAGVAAAIDAGGIRRIDARRPDADQQVLDLAVEAYGPLVTAAREGADPVAVLAHLDEVRVLCAHRRGPAGVERWNGSIAHALAQAVPGFRADQPTGRGRPVLVTENDHVLRLYNGDVGVFVADPQDSSRTVAAFPAADGGVRVVAPARLPAHETTFAMTIHKSQGSQFRHAIVVLGQRPSPLLTRELVYTAVTRAAEEVTWLATDEVLDAALARPVQRASGLGPRLWGAD